MAYIMRPFAERLFWSPIANSQILAQQRPTSKCTIIVSQLVVFFIPCLFFSIFFIGRDPQMYILLATIGLNWSRPRL